MKFFKVNAILYYCESVVGGLGGWMKLKVETEATEEGERESEEEHLYCMSVLSPIYAATNQKTVRDSFRLEILGSDKEY